jgi:LAO/AO transport system kinase
MWQELLQQIKDGDIKALARSISYVENEQPGYETLLSQLPHSTNTKIIGITGPPGAGKSTLVDGLIGKLVESDKKVAVLCVDPSSPFNLGAVLGDRIRMSQWYLHPNVFIRSLATRGSMGGLHPKIIEIADLLKAAGFDHIIIETVGVGQSEIEIAGLADTTVVVVVPEAGDEVQTMKAGLMEIADIFVVNKSDRPEADAFVKNLRQMLAPAFSNHQKEIPVIKTVASQGTGLNELVKALSADLPHSKENQVWLLTERLYQLVQKEKMKKIDKTAMKNEVARLLDQNQFNLYRLAEQYKFD